MPKGVPRHGEVPSSSRGAEAVRTAIKHHVDRYESSKYQTSPAKTTRTRGSLSAHGKFRMILIQSLTADMAQHDL